jgi:hypothetical protein
MVAILAGLDDVPGVTVDHSHGCTCNQRR